MNFRFTQQQPLNSWIPNGTGLRSYKVLHISGSDLKTQLWHWLPRKEPEQMILDYSNCRCKEPSQTYVKVECIKMEALSSIKECRHDEWEFWEPDLKKSQLAAEITTRSCCLPSSDDNIPVTWSCMTLQNLTSTDHGTHNNSSKPTEPQDTFLMRFTSCTTPTTSYPC